MPSNYFESDFGLLRERGWLSSYKLRGARDLVYDAKLALIRSHRELSRRVAASPEQKILIVGVDVPARSSDLTGVLKALAFSRHQVTTRRAEMHQGLGKFQNINRSLEDVDVAGFDWLIVVDDDVSLPRNFLDEFLYFADMAGLAVCQPAHKIRSYQTYALTQRQWGSLVRRTHFVESGPITAFRRTMFPFALPFPELRWAWGTELPWSESAREKGLAIGIVDATPIGHLRPVAQSYGSDAAVAEGAAYLSEAGVKRSRAEFLQTTETFRQMDGR